MSRHLFAAIIWLFLASHLGDSGMKKHTPNTYRIAKNKPREIQITYLFPRAKNAIFATNWPKTTKKVYHATNLPLNSVGTNSEI